MILELECPVKQYHWGKVGLQSFVAFLKQSGDPSFKVNAEETYAELWMGTHPSGPAFIKGTNTPLHTWILENPDALGEVTRNTFGSNLPFLFKILSVRMPLSIQVHPSKETAEQLHSAFPELYKDPNHKPELAIALTRFEALCGFRPINEIKKFLNLIPELSEVIGKSKVNDLLESDESQWKDQFKECFRSLMTAPEDTIKVQLDQLLNRMASMEDTARADTLGPLLYEIHYHFPGDVGCFCIYFLNYLVLQPGEAIYLGANEPHAYISGNCIECMACSDNVVRAGLTPKYRDVDTLIEILNYTCSPASSKLLRPEIEGPCSTIYRPPISEFVVCKVDTEGSCSVIYRPPVPEFAVRQVYVASEDVYDLNRNSPSIVIIIEGSAKIGNIEATAGKIYFIPAGESHKVQIRDSTVRWLRLYQAYVNL